MLGLGFTAAEGGDGRVEQESMFMVTELCSGGTLREMVLRQMIAGRRVRAKYCFIIAGAGSSL